MKPEYLCITCKYCNKGEIIDEYIAMFDCIKYGIKVYDTKKCSHYKKILKEESKCIK